MTEKTSERVSDKVIEIHEDDHLEQSVVSKAFGRSFTRYFCLLFGTTSIVITMVSYSLLLKSEQSDKLIEQQLTPIKVQLQEMSYLLAAVKHIDNLLTNDSVIDYPDVQKKLNEVSHKLSYVNSANRKTYQQWVLKGKGNHRLATQAANNHNRNQDIKTLLQAELSSLQAIVNEKQTPRIVQFNKINVQLQALTLSIDSLGITSSVEYFEQLRLDVEALLSSKFSLALRQKLDNGIELSSFELGLLNFESTLIEQAFIAKWQGHLRLIHQYRQLLVDMKKELNNKQNNLSDKIEQTEIKLQSYHSDTSILTLIKALADLPTKELLFVLSITIVALFTIFLYFFIAMRSRIKKYRVIYDENFSSLQQTKNSATEVEKLRQQCQKFLAELVTSQEKQNKISLELELLEYTNNARAKTQFSAQQTFSKELLKITKNQLVEFLPASFTVNDADEYLNTLFMQSKLMAIRLKQAGFHSYLQNPEARLSLSDVNLISEVQAVVLNHFSDFIRNNNKLSLTIAKNIQVDIKLDAEVFSEIIRVFIQLLLIEKNNTALVIKLSLQDKNDGQQCIAFTGHVQMLSEHGEASKVKLPNLLQYIHNGNHHKAESELLSYFYTLLAHQHGDQVLVSLTEQGYQLSFTMPLAVMLNRTREKDADLVVNPTLYAEEQKRLNLVNTYKSQPIEVLLSIKKPQEHQVLLQLLQNFGLHVLMVTRATSQDKHWRSGRFTILITEFSTCPFVDFNHNSNQKSGMKRAVLTLDHLLNKPTGDSYKKWTLAEVKSLSNITVALEQLTDILSPWLKIKSDVIDSHRQSVAESHREPSFNQEAVEDDNKLSVLDFEQYIVNQGSVELAVYMLDDYIFENSVLLAGLSQALTEKNIDKASRNIDALLLNAKIIASSDLLKLCHHWQKFLSTNKTSENNALQVKLLAKTKQAIAAIAHYAQVA